MHDMPPHVAAIVASREGQPDPDKLQRDALLSQLRHELGLSWVVTAVIDGVYVLYTADHWGPFEVTGRDACEAIDALRKAVADAR